LRETFKGKKKKKNLDFLLPFYQITVFQIFFFFLFVYEMKDFYLMFEVFTISLLLLFLLFCMSCFWELWKKRENFLFSCLLRNCRISNAFQFISIQFRISKSLLPTWHWFFRCKQRDKEMKVQFQALQRSQEVVSFLSFFLFFFFLNYWLFDFWFFQLIMNRRERMARERDTLVQRIWNYKTKSKNCFF